MHIHLKPIMAQHDTAFLTQQQNEEVFLKGLFAINKSLKGGLKNHKTNHQGGGSSGGISQEELKKISLDIISDVIDNRNKNKNTVSLEDAKKLAEQYDFYHWFEMHQSVGHTTERANVTFGHTEMIPPGNIYDCNHAADEWFNWFLTTPRSANPYSNPGEINKSQNEQYGMGGAFLLRKRNTSIYFTTAAPFQEPDMKTITLTETAPLLVPAYNVSSSIIQFPSLDDENSKVRDRNLQSELISDLLGIIPDSVQATLDGQTIEPCPVIRKDPLLIEGIPEDNVFGLPKDRLITYNSKMELLHAGFWMLIRPERLKTGDHLLKWKIESLNYEMNVELRINSLT